MQKLSDLPDVQKGMIIGFRAKGGSISETAEFVNYLRAAVVKVYRAWQNGIVQNQRHGKCGAPRAIDDRGERRLHSGNILATVEQLSTKMNQRATKSLPNYYSSNIAVSSPTICSNAAPQPSFASVIYVPWCTTFLLCTVLLSRRT